MRRDRLALLSFVGSTSPVTRPPRSTGAVVAQRADLVELVADVQDAAALPASRRSVTKSLSTACGVSTEVGSSRMSSLGSVISARTISTRCRSPTDSVCTGRSGSTSRP
jgi:hypothetical protein